MNGVLYLYRPWEIACRGRRRGYIIGLIAMGVLVAARRYSLDGFLETPLPLRLFIIPVIAAAWAGGWKPGMFTALLGAVAAPYFFSESSLKSLDWEMTMTYLSVAIVVSGVLESSHAAQRRLQDRQRLLEHEVIERQKAEAAERTQRDRLTQEIQQRMLAESALREREERIRMAVESANIGTWDLNVCTGERRWSDRTKEIFGLNTDEEVSKFEFLGLVHPDDREGVNRAIQRALDPQGDGRYEVEYRAHRPDGTIRWIIGRGQAFFDGKEPSRRAIRFIGTVVDFTDRKELEQALRDADRRKDEFLATLAHELRNPLTPISNALQIWPLVEDDPRELVNLRNMMGRQVQQITRLINDLMDVSRITRGKIQLQKQQADIGTIIESAIESVESIVEACGHQMTVTLPDEPVLVDGDVARLVQVFANILNNAAKYTGRNGVIWVSVAKQDENVVVRIRDNGPGIPSHLLKDIFEMFHQVDETTSRCHGGLGIGLTLVKQLVELHGGTVQAFSEGPGTGSEFVVSLPGLVSAPSARKTSGPHYQMQQINVLPPHRILVVDDVNASAETLALMLRGMGQTAVALHDGQTAIDWVNRHKPDAVFLDIAMPSMDGYEVARSIRNNPATSAIPLIALTGYGQEEDRRRASEAGFNHHIVKPPSIDALEQILRSIPNGNSTHCSDHGSCEAKLSDSDD